MAFIADKVRTMDALLWMPKGPTQRNGTRLYEAPRPIKVFWVDFKEERVTTDGSTFLTTSKIFVGEELPLGAYLKLGVEADVPTFDAPRDPVRCGAVRVVDFKTIRKPRGNKVARIAYT